MRTSVQTISSRSVLRLFGGAVCATAVLAAGQSVIGQQLIPSHYEKYEMSSGRFDNDTAQSVVVFEHTVILDPGVSWMRVVFKSYSLPAGSYLQMTSLLDGDTQTLDAQQLVDWGFRSSYFNGSSVSVELVAGPNTRGNAVEIGEVLLGQSSLDLEPNAADQPQEIAICGGVDGRALSANAAVGRLIIEKPQGTFICTGFIIDTPTGIDKCHLSAGHCFQDWLTAVLQFDVPLSVACGIVNPPATEQFAVTKVHSSNVQCSAFPAAHDDWSVFECALNPVTGLTTFQEQAAALGLAAVVPSDANIEITGYGADGGSPTGVNDCDTCAAGNPDDFKNFTQQSHKGTLFPCPAPVPGTLYYDNVDTCGGSSGSPVVDQGTGTVIGIHTHAGCKGPVCCPGFLANAGTKIDRPLLVAAIATCKTQIAPIPTVSEWGLIVMTLLLLAAGTIVIRRHKAQAAGGTTPA